MRRRQITHHAKQMVLHVGPSNILEFGEEYLWMLPPETAKRDREAVLDEAVKQAKRVYAFLGYISPYGE